MANKKFLTFGAICALSLLGLYGCDQTTSNSNTGGNIGSNDSTGGNTGVTHGASGGFNYQDSSYDERAKITAQLEKYAMDNNITGISLYDDGGLAIYNKRLEFPTDEYVPGYGTGLLREGNIRNQNINDNDTGIEGIKWYIHYFSATFPSQINGANDQGSEVSDYDSSCHYSLYSTRLKTDANGDYLEEYEWYPLLASRTPEPMDTVPGTNLAHTYRVYLRTGSQYTYSTLTDDPELKKFNNQEIKPEDYEFAMRMLLSGDIGFYRASQYTSDVPLEGASNYYNVSRQYGWKSAQADEAWEKVGYHVEQDETTGEYYIEIKYQNACTPFYAMYQTTSFTTPVPQEFFEIVTHSEDDSNYRSEANYLYYGGTDSSKGRNPVDTYLSVGPYTLETWNTNLITYRRNDNWYERVENPNLYRIRGIKYVLDPGLSTNGGLGYQHFQKNECDSTSIPDIYYKEALQQYPDQIHEVPGTSNFKMNVNSCDEETWIKLFGTNGTITQTPKSNYWKVEPIMSNKKFLQGLFFSSNREAVAQKLHRNPAFEYFSDAYMIDPENNISYNSTSYHQEVIADYSPETYGYSPAVAQILFSQAIEEEYNIGNYRDGDTITLKCYLQSASDITGDTGWAGEWSKYIEENFNKCDFASQHNITLSIINDNPANWSDVYYAHAMVGQFDFAFGSVSGNTMDPLNFMEVLKSDNSSGFTLNWGVDTSENDGSIVYGTDSNGNPMTWSFDALWEAANNGTMVKEGKVAVPYIYKEGSATITTIDYIPEDDEGQPEPDKKETHTALQVQFGVDIVLLNYANISMDPEVPEEGEEIDPDDATKPSGINSITLSASVYNPNASYENPTSIDSNGHINSDTVNTYSISTTADKIAYDAATQTLTVTFDLEVAFEDNLFLSLGYSDEEDLTDEMIEMNETYKNNLLESFKTLNTSYHFMFAQNMTINNISSTQNVSLFQEDTPKAA